MSPAAKRRLRCAIYTRKSSEEGLEQEFNSLHAQREACDAFIRSQRHEGWYALPERYDDGGISGATMDRPALRQLLADVAAGRIDVVVVYKVDRLTRALSDFAKIVEIFDARGVSFVSVTQQFNTTSSMGRLTLNVLLSFAQFEREVTAERIRDKIAASKKKGLWMGGTPPLGYAAQDRRLVVIPSESDTVRRIFERYLALGSVRLLKDELDAHGIVSKAMISASGRHRGGVPLARGALYAMLKNRIYIGEIVHRGHQYPGQHAAIVERPLWEAVQAKLAANAVERDTCANTESPSLLAGLIFDAAGIRLIPTHAIKTGRRYRYYVSKALITGDRDNAADAYRIPAGEIEALVAGRIRAFLCDRSAIFEMIKLAVPDGIAQSRLIERADALAHQWPDLPPPRRRLLLRTVITRVEVHPDRVAIRLSPVQIRSVLSADTMQSLHVPVDDAPVMLVVVAQLKRVGMSVRMLIDGNARADARATPDRSLVRLLAKAHALTGQAAAQQQRNDRKRRHR